MSNGRAFRRSVSGDGLTAADAKRNEKKRLKSLMRPNGSPRTKLCPTHGAHKQLWSTDFFSWVNEEDWVEAPFMDSIKTLAELAVEEESVSSD